MDAEREAFEKWYVRTHEVIETDENGRITAYQEWAAWQAARASTPAPQARCTPTHHICQCGAVATSGNGLPNARLRGAAPEVPAGMALVPVEPTEAMLRAGYDAGLQDSDAWGAMLAAAIQDEEKKDGR